MSLANARAGYAAEASRLAASPTTTEATYYPAIRALLGHLLDSRGTRKWLGLDKPTEVTGGVKLECKRMEDDLIVFLHKNPSPLEFSLQGAELRAQIGPNAVRVSPRISDPTPGEEVKTWAVSLEVVQRPQTAAGETQAAAEPQCSKIVKAFEAVAEKAGKTPAVSSETHQLPIDQVEITAGDEETFRLNGLCFAARPRPRHAQCSQSLPPCERSRSDSGPSRPALESSRSPS